MYLHLIRRKDAIAHGLDYYYTGKPCVNGGISIRRASGSCMCEYCNGAKKEQLKKYYSNNSEKMKAARRSYVQQNKEKVALCDKRFYIKNIESIMEKKKIYHNENKPKLNKYAAEWRKSNRPKCSSYRIERKAACDLRTPSWYGDLDRFCMVEAFHLAAERLSATGVEWHVDHMIPLRSKKASGLHCWQNIQVIPALMNHSKRSKMIYTEPFEWMYSV